MIQLQSLTASGFKNLSINNLEFPAEGNILVIGQNESGKSSLFEAIYFALIGDLLVAENKRAKANAIAYTKETATVELTFQKEGIPAKIRRKLSRNRSANGAAVNVEFWTRHDPSEPWHKEEGKPAKINPIIEEFLGFDAEMLLNSCFVQQKKLDAFLQKDPKDRKKIIDKLLNMEKLTDMKEELETKRKKLEKVYKHFEQEKNIEIQTEKIEKIKNVYSKVDKISNEIQILGEMADKKVDFASNIIDLKEFEKQSIEKLKDLDNKINKLNQEKDELSQNNEFKQQKLENKKDLNNTQELLNQKIQNHSELLSQKKHFEKSIDEFHNNIERKKKNKEYLSEITKVHKKLDSQRELVKEIQNLKQKNKNFNIQIKEQKKSIDALKKQISRKAKKIISETKDQLNQIPENFTNSYKNEQDFKSLEKEKNKISQQIDQADILKDKEHKKTILIQEQKKLKSDIIIIKKEIAEHEKYCTSFNNETKQIQKVKESVKTKEKCMKVLKNQLEELENNRRLRKEYDNNLNEEDKLIEKRKNLISKIKEKSNNIEQTKKYISNLQIIPPSQIPDMELKLKNLKNNHQSLNYNYSNKELEKMKEFRQRIQNSSEIVPKFTKNVFTKWIGGSGFLLILSIILGIIHPSLFACLIIPIASISFAFLNYKGLFGFSRKNPKWDELKDNLSDFIDSSLLIKNKIEMIRAFPDGKRKILEKLDSSISLLDKQMLSQNIFKSVDVREITIQDIKKMKEEITALEEKLIRSKSDLESGKQKKEEWSADLAKNQKELEDLKKEEILLNKNLKSIQEEKTKFLDIIVKNPTDFWNEKIQQNRDESNKNKIEIEHNQENIKKSKLKIKELDVKIKSFNLNEKSLQVAKNMKDLDQKLKNIKTIEQNINKIKEKLGNFDLPAAKEQFEQLQNDITVKKTKLIELKKTIEISCKKFKINLKLPTVFENSDELPKIQHKINDGLTILEELAHFSKFELFLTNIPKLIDFYKNLDVEEESFEELNSDFTMFRTFLKNLDNLDKNVRDNKESIQKIKINLDEEFRDDFSILFKKSEKNMENRAKSEKIEADLIEFFKRNLIEDLDKKKQENIQKLKENEKTQLEYQKIIKDLGLKIKILNEKIDPKYKTANLPELLKKNEIAIKERENQRTKLNTTIETQKKGLFKNLMTFIKKGQKIQLITSQIPKKIEKFDEANDLLKNLQINANLREKRLSKEFQEVIKKSRFNFHQEKSLSLKERLKLCLKSFNKEKIEASTKIDTANQTIKKIKVLSPKKNNPYYEYKDLFPSKQKIFEKIDFDFRVLKASIDILNNGSTQISKKVVPKTKENLSHILPILTAGRYKDCNFGLEDEDYNFAVFDSKRGDYVSKILFSGGTNDQIALAVRLAFAMATMKDYVKNESFIFLDEPLGFFDDERRSALIDFLTHGSIANKFAQRFIVSNFLDIKPYFDYVIELENGHVLHQSITGSLASLQSIPKDQPILLDEQEFLELKTYECEEDYGCCDGILNLHNKSSYVINTLEIQFINRVNIRFSPKHFYNQISPNEIKLIHVSFSNDLLDLGEIDLLAAITYIKNNKAYTTTQILKYCPEILN